LPLFAKRGEFVFWIFLKKKRPETFKTGRILKSHKSKEINHIIILCHIILNVLGVGDPTKKVKFLNFWAEQLWEFQILKKNIVQNLVGYKNSR
jgi:hypothetical protein